MLEEVNAPARLRWMQATVRNTMAKDTMAMGKGMDMMVMAKVTMVAAAVVTETVMGMTRMAMDTQKAMDIRMATAPRPWMLMQKLKGMAMKLMEKVTGMTRAMTEAAAEAIMEMVMDMTRAMEMVTLVTPKAV